MDDENKNGMADTLKKLFSAGVSAAFMTEESIRAYVSDLKLPKEVLSSLLAGAQSSKDELVKAVSREAVEMVKKIDFSKEAARFMENHKFKVTAEIEVLKKEDGDKTLEVKVR